MKKAPNQTLRPVYRMVDHALASARNGWCVFPCRETGPKAKAPYTATGFKEASYTPQVIKAWWSKWPHALIGAVVPDSLIVLDLDPRHGGTKDVLEAVTGPLPPTLTVLSGRGDGGLHLYYRKPAGDLTDTGLPDGVDLRKGGKHYCIIPPSKHPVTGEPYTWLDTRPPAVLPARAVEAIRRPEPVLRPVMAHPSNPGGLVDWFNNEVGEGNRNNALFWALKRCAEEGDTVTAKQLADMAVSKGLTEPEVARTVRSAFGGGAL